MHRAGKIQKVTLVGLDDEFGQEVRDKEGVSGFCCCNRKKPVPGPGTGVLGPCRFRVGRG